MASFTDLVESFTGEKAANQAEQSAAELRGAGLGAARQLRSGVGNVIDRIEGGARDANMQLIAGLQGALGPLQASRDDTSRLLGQGIDAISGSRDDINYAISGGLDALNPFATGGTEAFNSFVAGSTPRGFSDNISALTRASRPLVDERRREVEGALSAAGLSRSNAGIEAIADVPLDVLLDLEDRMSGRQFAAGQQGQTGASSIASLLQAGGRDTANIAALEAGALGNLSDSLSKTRALESSLISGSRGQRAANTMNASLASAQTLADLEKAIANLRIGSAAQGSQAGIAGAAAQQQGAANTANLITEIFGLFGGE